MGIRLTAREARQLQGNGSLMLPLDSVAEQPKATYYNRYGDKLIGLPADARSLEYYLRFKRYTLTPPVTPATRPEPSAEMLKTQGVGQTEDPTAVGANPPAPTATYYTAEGTPVSNLPADPESMAAYLAQGLTLSPPVKVVAIQESDAWKRQLTTARPRASRSVRFPQRESGRRFTRRVASS